MCEIKLDAFAIPKDGTISVSIGSKHACTTGDVPLDVAKDFLKKLSDAIAECEKENKKNSTSLKFNPRSKRWESRTIEDGP